MVCKVCMYLCVLYKKQLHSDLTNIKNVAVCSPLDNALWVCIRGTVCNEVADHSTQNCAVSLSLPSLSAAGEQAP